MLAEDNTINKILKELIGVEVELGDYLPISSPLKDAARRCRGHPLGSNSLYNYNYDNAEKFQTHN
ncbi:MAG: hypothetical protein QXI67_05070 [Candidatus Bathyarchaeia archaeon]